MATKNGGTVNIGIKFNVDKSGLNLITKSLQAVQDVAKKDLNLDSEFKQAAAAAGELQRIVSGSWNDKLNQLNLNKFNQSIQQSFGSVLNLKNQLVAGGAAGQTAFASIASSVLNTNVQLRLSNKLLDSMATSMANTIKWGITSKIFNSITGSIQQAYYYAKDLNTSLIDIRMVTGDSADEMLRFAKNANEISKSLGRSTLDYTKAAVEYYRQGLSDEQVAARTNITLKAQNITGAGKEMVDYLTAVWNGFQYNTENAEKAVDSLAKVADSSASNMSELATAMSKVAATANVVGVDFDQLNAMIATVVATTRLAPESVGTAFKTVFARINDIKTGAEDAEISLGNYTSRMLSLGISVLNAEGRLRDTGDTITEVGLKWKYLTKEQQIYLASTMGGQRQITQVMALFDNWDQYVELLNTSIQANGTLNEKNNIYLESTAAHLEQLGALAERLYAALIDTDALNPLIDTLKGALSLFNNFVEGIGGGTTAFINFGATIANLFNKQIGTAINNTLQNIERIKNNLQQVKAQLEWSQVALTSASVRHMTSGDIISQAALQKEAEITQRTLEIRKGLTQLQYNELQEIQRQVGVQQTQIDYIESYKENLKLAGLNEETNLNTVIRRRDALDLVLKSQKAIRDTLDAMVYPLVTSQYEQWKAYSIDVKEELQQIGVEGKDLNSIMSLLGGTAKQGLLTYDKIDEILSNHGINIKNNEVAYNNLVEAAKKMSMVQDGTLEKTKQELSLREQLVQKIQENAQKLLTIQGLMRGLTGGIQAASALVGGITTAIDESATASEKLNGTWQGISGTLGGIANIFMPGSGILIQGVFSLIQGSLKLFGVWDDLELLFMSAEEKIEKYSNQLKEGQKQYALDAKTISSLKLLQEEYKLLSLLAGDYGKNVNNLTLLQKLRYHLITNLFAKYNEDVIAGYDEQGNAIVKNNTALEQTIALLELLQSKSILLSMGGSAEAWIKKQQSNYSLLRSLLTGNEYQTYSPFQSALRSGVEGILDWPHLFGAYNTWSEDLYADLSLINFGFFTGGDAQKLQEVLLQVILDGITVNTLLQEISNIYGKGFQATSDDIQKASLDIIVLTNFLGTNFANNFRSDVLLGLSDAVGQFNISLEQLKGKANINALLLTTVIKYGEEKYSQAYKLLKESDFYNEGFESLIYAFASGWTIGELGLEVTFNAETGEKRGGLEQIVLLILKYVENLKTAGLLIEDASQNLPESILDFEGETLAKKLVLVPGKLAEIINNLDIDEDAIPAAYSYLLLRMGLTGLFKYDEEGNFLGLKAGSIKTKLSNLVKETSVDILKQYKTLFGTGLVSGINLNNFVDTELELTSLLDAVLEIDWIQLWKKVDEMFEESASKDKKTREAIFKQVFLETVELIQSLIDKQSLNFDVLIDSDSLISKLLKKKDLTDEELDTLNQLEVIYPLLASIQELTWRGSPKYIEFLQSVQDKIAELLKEEVGGQKEGVLSKITAGEKFLSDYGLNVDSTEDDLKRIAGTDETLFNDLQQAQLNILSGLQELINLKYQLAQIDYQITENMKLQAALAQAKKKALWTTVQNSENVLKSLQEGKALTGLQDLATLKYLLAANPLLSLMVTNKGIEVRFQKEYLLLLAQTINSETLLTRERLKQEEIENRRTNIENLKTQQQQTQDFIDYMNTSDVGTLENLYGSGTVQWWQQVKEAWQAYADSFNELIDSLTDALLFWEQVLADIPEKVLRAAIEALLSIDKELNKSLVLDPSGLYEHLEAFESLSDAELAYLGRLEDEDDKLKEIAKTSGRNSEEYIKYLKTRQGLAQKIYKEDLEAEKEKLHYQAIGYKLQLQYRTDLKEDLRKTILENILILENEILNIEYEEESVGASLVKQAKERALAAIKLRDAKIESAEKAAQEAQKAQKSSVQQQLKYLQQYQDIKDIATGEKLGSLGDYGEAIAYLREQFDLTGALGTDEFTTLLENISEAVESLMDETSQAIVDMNNVRIELLEKDLALLDAEIEKKQNEDKPGYGERIAGGYYIDDLSILESELNLNNKIIERAEKQKLLQLLRGLNILLGYKELEQELIINQTYRERLDLFNSLVNRDDLDLELQNQLKDLLSYLVELYPELSTAATILNDTWLVGTQAYNLALKEVEDTLEQLKYLELLKKLDDLSIHIDLENLDDCMDEIEEFLDVEREILISVHTDALNEFDKLQALMDRIYDASSKIGLNFVVAANDIRELNNVFPGILENMQNLHDGTVQLNQDAVQQAIAGASQVVAADAQSVNQQLQSQANLLHAKATMYQTAGDIANKLAQGEIEYADLSASLQSTLMAAAGSARIDAASQTAQALELNFSNVATESGNAAASMAENFSGGANAMANAIAQMTQHAIANLSSIASASGQVMSGSKSVSAAVDWGGVSVGYSGGSNRVNTGNVTNKTISSSYGGGAIQGVANSLGFNGIKNTIKDALGLSDLSSNTQDDWALLRDQFYDLAAVAEKGANDILGMMAETMLDLDNLANELGQAASGRPGSGSGGGGGGGGSRKEPEIMDYLDELVDRYHDINMELARLTNEFEKLAKLQDKLFGKKLIDNLNKQLQLLEDQIQATKFKLELTKEELKERQLALSTLGVTFDQNDYISNYNLVVTNKLNLVNATIDYYNSLTAEQQLAYKDVVEGVKEEYENLKTKLSEYDTLISETIPDLQEQISDKIDEQFLIKMKHFTLSVELELDMSKAERDFNEFKKKVIDKINKDNVLGNTGYLLRDYLSYFNSGTGAGSVGALMRQIQLTMAESQKMRAGLESLIYGRDLVTALSDLKKYTDLLMNALKESLDIAEEIELAIYDAIDQAQKGLDSYQKTFTQIDKQLSHDVEMIQLIYGDEAYDRLLNYYTLIHTNDLIQLDSLRQQKDSWEQLLKAESEHLATLTDLNDIKKSKDLINEYKEHWIKTMDLLNSAAETAVNNIVTKYGNAVSKILHSIGMLLTNGMGTNYVKEEWELINKLADLYLDKVTSNYEILKLKNSYQDALNKYPDNIKAQKSLNDLMQVLLSYLKDKDKLTQYDVDRANLLLQIEMQRLALEDARGNKTKLRLRRNSQGNYTYEYTADTEEIQSANQKLVDLQYQLWELSNTTYSNTLSSLYDTYAEWEDKMTLAATIMATDYEKGMALAQLYTEYYGNIINEIIGQNQVTEQDLFYDTFTTLANMYTKDMSNWENMNLTEKQLTRTFISDLMTYYNINSLNWKNMTLDQQDSAAAFFEYLAGAYGINTENFATMTLAQKEQAKALFELAYGDVSLRDSSNSYFDDYLPSKYNENLIAWGNYLGTTQGGGDSLISIAEEGFNGNGGIKDIGNTGLSGINFGVLPDNMKNALMDLANGIIPQWNSALADMAKNVNSEDGFKGISKKAFGEIQDAAGKCKTEILNAGIAANGVANGGWSALDSSTDNLTKKMEGLVNVLCGDDPNSIKTIAGAFAAALGAGTALIGKDGEGLKGVYDATSDLINKYAGENGLITQTNNLANALLNAKLRYKDLYEGAKDTVEQAWDYWNALSSINSEAEKLPLEHTIQIKYSEEEFTPSVPDVKTVTVQYNDSGSSGGGGSNYSSGGGGGAGYNTGTYSLPASKTITKTSSPLYYIRGYNEYGSYVRIGPLTSQEVYNLSTKNWKSKAGQIEVTRASDGSKRYMSPGNVVPFDTGGYTGDWVGNNGMLATLHKKELVLNAEDTENLLKAVDVTRTINDLLSNIKANTNIANVFSTMAGVGNGSALDQNVHITATFPNVKDHNEIEQALETLVNRASQYAFRTR